MRTLTILGAGCALLLGCGSDNGDVAERGGEADRRLVFVTQDRLTGGFGSDADADAACQARAENAGFVGTFRAWLSGGAGPAAQKVDDAPYVLTDGTRVANNRTDLLDGTLLAPINLDEDSQQIDSDVWTGTEPDGTSAAETCAQWTIGDNSTRGVCGSTVFTDERWTDNLVPRCNTPLHLFCFEQ